MQMGIDNENKIPFVFFQNLLKCRHPADINLRWAKSSRIYLPNPNFLAFVVSQIFAFIRTDGHG